MNTPNQQGNKTKIANFVKTCVPIVRSMNTLSKTNNKMNTQQMLAALAYANTRVSAGDNKAKKANNTMKSDDILNQVGEPVVPTMEYEHQEVYKGSRQGLRQHLPQQGRTVWGERKPNYNKLRFPEDTKKTSARYVIRKEDTISNLANKDLITTLMNYPLGRGKSAAKDKVLQWRKEWNAGEQAVSLKEARDALMEVEKQTYIDEARKYYNQVYKQEQRELPQGLKQKHIAQAEKYYSRAFKQEQEKREQNYIEKARKYYSKIMKPSKVDYILDRPVPKKLPKPLEAIKYEHLPIKPRRSKALARKELLKKTMKEFSDWLLSYIPKPIKTKTNKAYETFKEKVMSFYKSQVNTFDVAEVSTSMRGAIKCFRVTTSKKYDPVTFLRDARSTVLDIVSSNR